MGNPKSFSLFRARVRALGCLLFLCAPRFVTCIVFGATQIIPGIGLERDSHTILIQNQGIENSIKKTGLLHAPLKQLPQKLLSFLVKM